MLDERAVINLRRWRIATWVVATIWTILMVRLMIADVWDETNGMLFFSNPGLSLRDSLAFVLTRSLGFWRPIPTVLAATVLHFVRSFAASWRILRGINIILLLCSAALTIRTVDTWTGRDGQRSFVITIAFLFSSSAVITAGWYANLFDASALVLVALAFFLMTHQRFLLAGLMLGAAFFCKETTALALAFFLPLIVARRLRLRDAFVAGIPAALFGLAYFILRGRIVAFGSAADVHSFLPQSYWPSALAFIESFWRQTMKPSGPQWLGVGWFFLSLAALRKPLLIGAAMVVVLFSTVIYWGMFVGYQGTTLISYRNFDGRLYLLPVALMILLLASERQTAILTILLVPIVWGGITTYRDHARFQRTYRQIYRMARETPAKPLRVDFAAKPLHDTVRGIEIGDFPDAPIILDPPSGRLRFRR